MRDIPDNRELTKIGWSVLKVIGIFVLFFLLTKCVSHAQSGQTTFSYSGIPFNRSLNDGTQETNYADFYAPVQIVITIQTSDANGVDINIDGTDYHHQLNGATITITEGSLIWFDGEQGLQNPINPVYTTTVTMQGWGDGTPAQQYTITGAPNSSPDATGDTDNYAPDAINEAFTLSYPLNASESQVDITVPMSDSDPTQVHSVACYVGGQFVGMSQIGPAQNGQTITIPANFSAAATAGETWSVWIDPALDVNGNPEVGTGTPFASGIVQFLGENQTVDTVLTQEASWTGPAPSPTPTPTPSPTPSATPSPTPGDSPTPSPTPGDSPTPSPTPGGSPTPSPSPGDSATPTPSPSASPSPSPSDSGTGLTEADIETAIRNTFGDTDGAPSPSQNDFTPQGNYTPPPDNITPGVSAANSTLQSDFANLYGMVPDLSAFTAIGTLYSFQLNLSGLGLGLITIDLSPFQSQIAFVRALVLAIMGLIFVIKFIKHIGPSI